MVNSPQLSSTGRLLHPAYDRAAEDEPDQRGDEIEQKLRAHRRTRQARNRYGHREEKVEAAPRDEDRCSNQFFQPAIHRLLSSLACNRTATLNPIHA